MTDLQRGLRPATAPSCFPAPIRAEAGTMPADRGLRPDDLQSVQHAGRQPIQPGKYQTVDAGEGQSLRRFTPQHVELTIGLARHRSSAPRDKRGVTLRYRRRVDPQ